MCVAMPGGCCLSWGWGFIVLNQSFQVKSVGQQLMRVVIGRKLLLFSRVAGQGTQGEGSVRGKVTRGGDSFVALKSSLLRHSTQFD